jgi:hypothetical protein
MRIWCGLTIVFSLALLAAGCGQPEFAEAARSYALECTAANGYPVNPFTDQVVCSFSNPVVFFAPHPDDETLGMGGAILAAKAAGNSVFIELMTHGDQSGGCGTCSTPPAGVGCGNQRVAWFREAARRMNVDGIYLNSDPSVPGSGPYVNTSVGGGFGDKQLLYSNGVSVNAGGGCSFPNMSPNPGVTARVNFWAAQGAALRGTSGTNELPHACHPDHLAVNMAIQNAAASDKKYYMVYIHEDYSDFNTSTNTHDAARVAGGSIAVENIHAVCGSGNRADGCTPSTGSGSGLKWALGAYPWTFSTTGLFTGNYNDCTASTPSAPAKAYLDPASRRLSVGKAGTGSGMVTSSPGGIDCGQTCSADFTVDTAVSLTASPDPGSTFAGWSGGGCSSTGGCTVTMSSDQSVTATFNRPNDCGLTVFCGFDQYGNFCGGCAPGKTCVGGRCEAQSCCGARWCGPDPCNSNLSCGVCGSDEICADGVCELQSCCDGRTCGPDPCNPNLSCGACSAGWACNDGVCTCPSIDECGVCNGPGKVCGQCNYTGPWGGCDGCGNVWYDACGVLCGDNSSMNACGVCNGPTGGCDGCGGVTNACGECNGPAGGCDGCGNVWWDACGQPCGDGSECGGGGFCPDFGAGLCYDPDPEIIAGRSFATSSTLQGAPEQHRRSPEERAARAADAVRLLKAWRVEATHRLNMTPVERVQLDKILEQQITALQRGGSAGGGRRQAQLQANAGIAKLLDPQRFARYEAVRTQWMTRNQALPAAPRVDR